MRSTSRALALLSLAPLVLAEPMAMGAIGVAAGVVAAPAVRAMLPRRSSASDVPINDETPEGVIDGKNRTFLLAYAAKRGSLVLHADRARQIVGQDFIYEGRTITFTADSVPQIGATLVAQYLR